MVARNTCWIKLETKTSLDSSSIRNYNLQKKSLLIRELNDHNQGGGDSIKYKLKKLDQLMHMLNIGSDMQHVLVGICTCVSYTCFIS
jgi:hypothetical protein